MKIRISDIEKRVIALLDENETVLNELTEYAFEEAEIGVRVRAVLEDAARIVLSSVPSAEIDEVKHLENPRIELDGDGRMVIRLPGDFLRLVRIRMSDWSRGVVSPMAEDGDEYSLRCGSSIRSIRRRGPAVAIVHRETGRVLEIFGSAGDAVPLTVSYLPVPKIDGLYIDLPASCRSAVERKVVEFLMV